MSHHLYEIVLESPQMWVKIQASCESPEQAMIYYTVRFGGKVLNLDADWDSMEKTLPPDWDSLYPYPTFGIPTKLPECASDIANWDSVSVSFPAGWHEHEFRLAEGPYPWCETLADGCDCYGSEGSLGTAYISDFGLAEDSGRRASKSANVRYAEIMRWWQERAIEMEHGPREQPPYGEAVKAMAEAILPAEPDPDRLIIAVITDRKNPRGRGVLVTLQRDPIGGLHRIPVTHYSTWGDCLQAIEERMNG